MLPCIIKEEFVIPVLDPSCFCLSFVYNHHQYLLGAQAVSQAVGRITAGLNLNKQQTYLKAII